MATITKGLIQREDFAAFDGSTLAATRTDSTGGTQTGTRVGNAVDVKRVYGSATSGALQKAVNLLGSTNIGIEFTPETWAITESVTVPSNLTCVVPAGCVFDVSAGKTLTIAGVLFRHHGTYKSGSGTVTVSGTDILASASQTGTDVYAADTGAADAYVISTGASISSYAAGQTFRFKALNANTGASTINVDGQGAKSLKLFGTSSALPANAILAGGVYTITYDGTNFQLQQQPVTSFIEGLLDDATAAAARTTLGVDASGTTLATTTGFLATPTSDQTGIADQTWTDVAFATEVYDKGGSPGDYATPNFTAPANGQYLLSWFILLGTQLTDGTLFGSRLYHTTNAVPISGSTIVKLGGAATTATSGAAIVNLLASDQVKLQFFHTLGSAVALDAVSTGAGGWGTMFFAGVRIS